MKLKKKKPIKFLRYAEKNGKKIGDQTFVKPFLKHQNIGELTACSRQTVNYILTDLRSKGIIDFDRSKHKVLSLEEFISMEICGVRVVAKPDLVYVNGDTGKTILLDYKTSKPFKQNGKIDDKKIKEYSKQLLLYAYILREVSNLKIDELQLWFLRYNELVTIPFTDKDIEDTVSEFMNGVNEIKNSTEYPANTKNEFFCQMLCSVSDDCEFKKVYVPKNQPEFIPE